MKRYMNWAFVYAILGLVGGVFFREFTKFYNFTGETTLGYLHLHYLVLGMSFFMIILLLDKEFSFSDKKTNKLFLTYHIGLNIMVLFLLIRGIVQVTGFEATKAMNAAISGCAGIGHILLGVSLVLIINKIRNSIK